MLSCYLLCNSKRCHGSMSCMRRAGEMRDVRERKGQVPGAAGTPGGGGDARAVRKGESPSKCARVGGRHPGHCQTHPPNEVHPWLLAVRTLTTRSRWVGLLSVHPCCPAGRAPPPCNTGLAAAQHVYATWHACMLGPPTTASLPPRPPIRLQADPTAVPRQARVREAYDRLVGVW